MKVKVIREKVGGFDFDAGWVTEGKVYEASKHPIWDDSYLIIDNAGDEIPYYREELEFVED